MCAVNVCHLYFHRAIKYHKRGRMMVRQTVAHDGMPQSNEELAQLFNLKTNITRNVKIVMETVGETIRVAIVRVETRRHHRMSLVPHLTRLSPRGTWGFAVCRCNLTLWHPLFSALQLLCRQSREAGSSQPGIRACPPWESVGTNTPGKMQARA